MSSSVLSALNKSTTGENGPGVRPTDTRPRSYKMPTNRLSHSMPQNWATAILETDPNPPGGLCFDFGHGSAATLPPSFPIPPISPADFRRRSNFKCSGNMHIRKSGKPGLFMVRTVTVNRGDIDVDDVDD